MGANPFLGGPPERLAEWKSFRRSLHDLSDMERLDRVAAFFAQAPVIKRAYDPTKPEDLPTPWEMVSKGEWDERCVAFGMEFTLRLSGIEAERLAVAMVSACGITSPRFIVEFDSRWGLNYELGSVTAIAPDSFEGLMRWRHIGKSYKRL